MPKVAMPGWRGLIGKAFCFQLALSLYAAAAFAGGREDFKAEDAYAHLLEVDKSMLEKNDIERAEAILAAYRRHFDDGHVSAVLEQGDGVSIGFVFDAAKVSVFYTNDPASLETMKKALAALEARGLADDERRSELYRSLIGLRRFEEARDYLLSHPGLDVEATPVVMDQETVGTGLHAAYRVGDDANSLQRIDLNIGQGDWLVVVAHPLCGFSRRAMQLLGEDETMAGVLQHTVWLAPPDQRLNLETARDWNREHVRTPIVLATARTDWPEFSSWATPTFYLMRDGKVIDHFSGWPKEGVGNRPALEQLLRKSDRINGLIQGR